MNVENPSTIGHSLLHTKEDTWEHLHECCLCAENRYSRQTSVSI